MTAGLIYECKWDNPRWMTGSGYQRGWSMLLFLRKETINRSDGIVVTNYRFHDLVEGKEVLMDESLAHKCTEVDVEAICT